MKLDLKLDFLKKAKKQEVMVFAVAACFLVLVGYYLLFLSPVISKFLAVFREVSRIQSKLDKAGLSIERTPIIKKEIDELKAKADFYSNKLPKEEEFPEVLEGLSDMAGNAGVKIIKVMPVKKSQDDFGKDAHPDIYSQQQILINAQCGYHQLGAFIAELESAERFMGVSDIKIEAGKISPKRHNVQLVVNTFLLRDE